MSFQPSINITYDIGKANIFEQYVPNINQLNIMETILSKLIFEQQHANLIVGPYGAGKSLVATMTTTLLTDDLNKKEIKQFFNDVFTVAPSIEEKLKEVTLQKNAYRWLPITITGKSGDFESIILESIEKQCKDLGVTITLKHDATYILELVDSWEKDFKMAYARLEEILISMNITMDDFKKNIASGDDEYVEGFKEIYPKIVFGTPYYNPKKLGFIEQIEYIFSQLDKKKIALFIVFDEFGRFLQTVSKQHIYDTMQAVQDLAEFSNRQSNMGLVLITHTGLQQYSTSNVNLSKEELERVEKRFIEHRLESDSSIYYRSAYKLLNRKEMQSDDMFLATDYENISYYILKYNLFEEMSKDEIEGTVISGCQPIHPLTIQLLPAISNQLGQNDRTLYMFLNQFNSKMLKYRWYYADQLFDYFYPDDAMLLTLDSMKYYRLALKYKISDNAIRLVKIMTLLSLVNNPYPVNIEFMHFALGEDKQVMKQVFKELIDVKLLRLNPFTKSFELYEGALVSVENLLKEVENSTVITDNQRCLAIESIFDEPYYLPLRYNASKSMTRFIKSHFILGELDNLTIQNKDGDLIYILTRSQIEKEKVLKAIEEINDDSYLFGLVEIDMVKFYDQVNEYLILEKVLSIPELLKQDNNLKQEIIMRLESKKYKIKQYMNPIKDFKDNVVQFYLAGRKFKVRSKYQFENMLDEWMFTRYPNTPEIRNESFNKSNIMTIQKKAAIQILEQILEPSFDGTFDINGNGPDYLIYATTFKNTGFNFENLDNQKNEDFALLRKALLDVLYKQNRNSISVLFDVALNKPFGIRSPLIPLLVVALLKDKWHQMAFYAKDFSISDMTASILFEILEHNASFYEFEIYDLDDEIIQTLEVLNEVYCNGQSIAHPHILFKDLNKWLLNLPRFTQITSKQPEEFHEFKQIIRSSESDPILASKKMLELKYTKEEFIEILETLSTFISKFKLHVIQKTLEVFDVQDKEEVKEKYAETVQKSPQLLEVVKILEKDDFIDELILKIVGVRLEDWSDVTYDSYFSTLEQLLIVNNSDVIQLVEGNQVVDTIKEMELSVKGQTIFKQLDRIVTAGGRTMNPDEVKFILYKILQQLK